MELPSKLTELMKKAKKMQSEADKAILSISVIGQSGGGLVKIQMNGSNQVLKVEISPELQTEDLDMLEDLIAAACNDAVHNVKKETNKKITDISKMIKLPDDFLDGMK